MAHDDVIQVEFSLSEDDLVRACQYLTEGSRRTRARRLGTRVTVVVGLILFAILFARLSVFEEKTGVMLWWRSALLLAIIPAFLIWHNRYWAGLPRRTVRKSLARGYGRDAIGRWRFELDPGGIRYAGPFGETRCVWRSISRLDVNDEFALFYLSEENAVPVPKGAFADEAEFRRFAETAARYREAAPAFEPKCPKCGYDLTGAATGGCPECGWRREE